MSECEPQIYCVHPITEDLRFLRRLIKLFRKKYPQTFRYLKLLNNDASHKNCLGLISGLKGKLILFLCHGNSDCILGCDFQGRPLDPTDQYEYGQFINGSNISSLAGNRIIAFCCYSNGIADACVKAGAPVAMGFDSIRFDYMKNLENLVQFKKIQQAVKYEMRRFLFDSITFAIDRNLSFLGLLNHMRLLLNKRSKQIFCSSHKHRQEIATILLEMKAGIKLFGDSQLKVLQ
jgi:hypothetical protein